MNIFETWQEQWFGLWKAKADGTNVPLRSEIVDFDWHPHDLSAIISYLENAQMGVCSSFPEAKCAFCDHVFNNPSVQKTDGVWVWPVTLAHDVEKHHVRLPDRMVDHIRKRHYRHSNDSIKSPKAYDAFGGPKACDV